MRHPRLGIIRRKTTILAHSCVKNRPYPSGLWAAFVLLCTQNRDFSGASQFWCEDFLIRQVIKNPGILAYFGIFLRSIIGKDSSKTDSSPSEDAVSDALFLSNLSIRSTVLEVHSFIIGKFRNGHQLITAF